MKPFKTIALLLIGLRVLAAPIAAFAQDMAVSPLQYDFGDVAVGEEESAIVTIENIDGAWLTVEAIQLEDESTPGAFYISSAVPPPPILIPIGGTSDVTVVFAPSTYGMQSCSLRIRSDGETSSDVSVPLQGVGVSTPPDLSSTFDTDTEGWGIYDNGSGAVPDYEPTGGNPGGFIKETDVTGNTWYFVAPSTWSGDLSGYIDGTLSYEIIILDAGQSHFAADDVRIWDGDPDLPLSSAFLYWNAGIDPPKPPGEAWTPFSVQINPANFTVWRPAGSTATFESIMAGVYAIHIRGEFIGANDTEGIDNVRLQAPAGPAPVPALSGWGVLFLVVLLGGIGFVGHAKRNGVK